MMVKPEFVAIFSISKSHFTVVLSPKVMMPFQSLYFAIQTFYSRRKKSSRLGQIYHPLSMRAMHRMMSLKGRLKQQYNASSSFCPPPLPQTSRTV